MTANPKPPVLSDPAYLRAIRDMRCIITGLPADADCSVVPHHVGHDKHRDDHAIPLRQGQHRDGAHGSGGEASFYRERLTDRLLVDCVRAYAEKMYRERS